ncbi:hypothetical protein GCM10027093_12850 [Paraburkholderia jirisanensis]
MRTITNIVVLLLLSPLSLQAATSKFVLDERALREECSAYPEAGMHDCLANKAAESQKALKNAENVVANALSRWDEDPKYVGLAKARLAASQQDFVKYRQSQCDFATSLTGGAAGNSHEIKRLACVAELNNRRAAQLSDSIVDLPLKQ